MLLIVDHQNKIVYPIDLKTSSHTEWDFYQSFTQWKYDIQARLYWRIIRENLSQDEIYKDYTLEDYRFVVVNRKTLVPLVWKFGATKAFGTLHFGKNDQFEMKDPFTLGKQLSNYLSSRPMVPDGIKLKDDNDIIEWLNKR